MQTFTATEAKNRLAQVMEAATREPVTIEKNGRPYIMMIPADSYRPNLGKLKKTKDEKKTFDDEFFSLCDDIAKTAKRNGMTEEILQSILNAPKA